LRDTFRIEGGGNGATGSNVCMVEFESQKKEITKFLARRAAREDYQRHSENKKPRNNTEPELP